MRARVSVELASTLGWARYVGLDGTTIGMQTFGASAPLEALQQEFGFTVDLIIEAARQQVERDGTGQATTKIEVTK